MKKKLAYILISVFFSFIIIYFSAGFYLAHKILYIDPTCGLHEDSLPNNWSAKRDINEYKIEQKRELRKNFPSGK